MFRCDSCGRMTQPGEKCIVTPIELRRVKYITPNKEPEGIEIAKEGRFCTKCAVNLPKPTIVVGPVKTVYQR